ncbi:MAG: hypothetical protein R6W91_05880 [Thermoplasmata archaeon]
MGDNMEKITLYAQANDTKPKLLIQALKNGKIMKANVVRNLLSPNVLYLTDVGDNIWRILVGLKTDVRIKPIELNTWGRSVKWGLLLITNNISVSLHCIPYWRAPTLPDPLAIKIEIEGEKEFISRLVTAVLNYSNAPPYDFKNWAKFEKKFGVTKEDCIATWKRYEK